jgi:hypothetical protein
VSAPRTHDHAEAEKIHCRSIETVPVDSVFEWLHPSGMGFPVSVIR